MDGATYIGGGRTRFRVWAPDRRRVEVVVESGSELLHHPMATTPDAYFEATVAAAPGTRYRYRLDGGEAFSDPCSRFQPEGPHGPSVVVDPGGFAWTDGDHRGAALDGAVLYELHIGTFTPEGTFRAVEQKLPYLRELGVTVVELMPVAAFPGRFNWGYDGTHLFAPAAVYGTPDDLRHLVNAAHAHGISVILDVVYNHLGPDGNYLWQYARAYFSERYGGEWGEPLNFDGPSSDHVRAFVVENVRHWIREYHFDGLRIDATQSMFDQSPRHILAELTAAARAAAPDKRLLLVAENEPQDARMVTPEAEGGMGCDTMWIDDFHHASRVALTYRREAYIQDYRGTAQELLSCARRNALYQGQWYGWQKKARGSPVIHLPPQKAVFFLQDHDQIANFLRGDRGHHFGPGRMRALTVFWLVLPQTPMFFMGQEFFASSPFCYFVDHKPELQAQVAMGRTTFLAQFLSARHAYDLEGYEERIGQSAFECSKLRWDETERHQGALELHKALLRLRREDPLFRLQDPKRLDGAVLGEQALVLRWFGDAPTGDRLLLLNLAPELAYDPCPQPLLAAPPGRIWLPVLSSEETRFGGHGAVFPDGEGRWTIPGQCGLILKSGGEAPHRISPEEQALALKAEQT